MHQFQSKSFISSHHFISSILIAQTTYFPIDGPATDQLNVHRHHSNISQFYFSLLSLPAISAFRNLNNSGITSSFYHLYLKMYLYNEAMKKHIQNKEFSKVYYGRQGHSRYESQFTIYFMSISIPWIKSCKGEDEPLLLPSFVYSLVQEIQKIIVSGHMTITGKIGKHGRMEDWKKKILV